MKQAYKRTFDANDIEKAIVHWAILAQCAGAYLPQSLDPHETEYRAFFDPKDILEPGGFFRLACAASAAADERWLEEDSSDIPPRGVDVHVRRGQDHAVVWRTEGHTIKLSRGQRQHIGKFHLTVRSREDQSWRVERLESAFKIWGEERFEDECATD